MWTRSQSAFYVAQYWRLWRDTPCFPGRSSAGDYGSHSLLASDQKTTGQGSVSFELYKTCNLHDTCRVDRFCNAVFLRVHAHYCGPSDGLATEWDPSCV